MKLPIRIMTHGILGNAATVDVGLAVLRIIVGVAFMTVFQKVPAQGRRVGTSAVVY